ncbi:MAG: peptide chain release factor aRF-1, partial [Candidatus Korarchaeota archaeon]
MSDDEYHRLKFKKMLKELAKKKGYHTGLISLYIPPDKQLPDIINYLSEEYNQSGNIKDKNNRKNVQTGITMIIQRLKMLKEIPLNGIAIFCGAIPVSGPGTERMEITIIEPPEPITTFKYYCADEYYLEPLKQMAVERGVYGLLLVDSDGAVIGLVRGDNIEILEKMTSGVTGKHHKGGQSQRRFERLHEESVHVFLKRVGEHLNNQLLPLLDNLEGIVVGGPGFLKDDFVKGDYVDYRIKNKILGTVSTSGSDEDFIDELVDAGSHLMTKAKIVKQKEAVHEFLKSLATNPKMVAYGLPVIEALDSGAVDLLLVSEELPYKLFRYKCPGCG